jgi:hypothetical protein
MPLVKLDSNGWVKLGSLRRNLRVVCEEREFLVEASQISPASIRAPMSLRVTADFPDIF